MKENLNNNKDLLIWLLASVTCLGPLTMDIYLPAFPTVMTALNTTPAMVQLTLTSWLLGFALGQIFAGAISDIIGRRKPLIISLTIFVLSVLACALSPNIYALIFFRLVGGLSASAAFVIARAVASDVYKGSLLTKVLATIMIIQGIGPVVAPVIGAMLLVIFSWQSIFFFLVLVAGIVLYLINVKYQETLPTEKRIPANFAHILKIFYNLSTHREFFIMCMMQFLAFASLFAYLSGMPFILQGIYGFTPQEFSWFFTIVGIGMMLFGKITNILAGRMSEVKLLKLALYQGAGFGFLFLLGIILDWNVYLNLGFLWVSQVSLPMLSSTSFSLALAKQGANAGSASALLGFYSSLAGALVAPLVSIGGENTALPTAIIVFGVEFLALLIFTYFYKEG